jgi:flavin reductase (DIM6/NTAB) family NADH-FMN oxidoreductase RutF
VKRVQHCADEPPTISVSVKKGHVLSPLIRDSARFGLCELTPSDRILTRLFARPAELLDEDPFLGHAMVPLEDSHDQPIPKCAATWLACDLLRHLDIESDYELYIGRVIESGVLSGGSGATERTSIPGRTEVDDATTSDDPKTVNRKRATA